MVGDSPLFYYECLERFSLLSTDIGGLFLKSAPLMQLLGELGLALSRIARLCFLISASAACLCLWFFPLMQPHRLLSPSGVRLARVFFFQPAFILALLQ